MEKVRGMSVSCAVQLALTRREWDGFIAVKSHLKLPVEDRGPVFAHGHAPKAQLWDASGNKLFSAKFDK